MIRNFNFYNKLRNKLDQIHFTNIVFFLELFLILLVIVFFALIYFIVNIKIDISIPVEKVASNKIIVSKNFISLIPNTKYIELKMHDQKVNLKIQSKLLTNSGMVLNLNTVKQDMPNKLRLIIAKKKIIEVVLSK